MRPQPEVGTDGPIERIEQWRLAQSRHFRNPERTFILAALNRETALLELAEIVEGV